MTQAERKDLQHMAQTIQMLEKHVLRLEKAVLVLGDATGYGRTVASALCGEFIDLGINPNRPIGG